MRPAAFHALSVTRCVSQSSMLCTCIRSKRFTPQWTNDSSICFTPRMRSGVQTLVALNTFAGPAFGTSSPSTASA